MPKIRCMGVGHSWTHFFADDGAWLLNTSGMKDLAWSADDPLHVSFAGAIAKGHRRDAEGTQYKMAKCLIDAPRPVNISCDDMP